MKCKYPDLLSRFLNKIVAPLQNKNKTKWSPSQK